MDKVTEAITFSRGISTQTQTQVAAELRNYFNNGWTLFSTHFAGIVGPELMMVYVLVKYAEPPRTIIQEHFPDEAAPAKKRGRPKKVVDEGNGFGGVVEEESPA